MSRHCRAVQQRESGGHSRAEQLVALSVYFRVWSAVSAHLAPPFKVMSVRSGILLISD